MRFGCLDLPPQRRVYGAFLVYSFCLGSLFPRLPDIRASLGVAEGALGLALDRHGGRDAHLVDLLLRGDRADWLSANHPGADPAGLGVLCARRCWHPMPWRCSSSCRPLASALGRSRSSSILEADRTEHQIGHRIMNRAHGFWSFGFFSSGLLGAFIAELGVSPQLHLFSMIPLVVIGTLLVLGRFNPAPRRTGTSTEAARRFAAPTLAIMVPGGQLCCPR